MKKIAVIGGPDITARIADRLKEENVEVVSCSEEEATSLNSRNVRLKTMEITNVYRNMIGFLPRGKKERITGYYNPETDKPKAGRNDPCICGSGRKFKNCCNR